MHRFVGPALVGTLTLTALAGWALAQPAPTTSSVAATTFRRAAQVRLADSDATRAEMIQAKRRPTAVALRQTLSQTATSRINLAAVDRVALPVLISARPALTSNLRVFARATSFTASAQEPGMTLVIDGSKTATAAPPRLRMPNTMILRPRAMLSRPTLTPAPAPAISRESAAVAPARSFGSAARSSSATPLAARPLTAREAIARQPRAVTAGAEAPPSRPAAQPAPAPTLQDVAIERTEYGLDVSFVRFGAVYNVSIACDAPDTDPRCSDEGAKALVTELETIGGGEAPQ